MTPNSTEVFNDLTPDEIKALGTFAQHVERNPNAVENLDLPGGIDYQMLQGVWSKIANSSREYVQS